MLHVLVCKLTFPAAPRPEGLARPAFVLRRVTSVSTSSSWRNLTSTATVQVAGRYLFQQQRLSIKDWLRRGDPIEIELGYNRALAKEFTGYVTDVKPGVPVTLTCEDEMYRLKRYPVKRSYEAVGLRQLLRDICPAGTQINALDTELGSFKAAGVTVAKVLDKLKEQYGLISYFRDGVLYCGKVYQQASTATATPFSFQRNGLGGVLEDELEYRRADDLHVIVEATSHQLKGKDLKVTVGDLTALDAERRTLQYFNLTSEADLKARAQRNVQRLKVSGYKGSFTTYGLPTLLHGHLVALSSSEYPERDGQFFVDGVDKSFSRQGYRQVVTLGSQASLAGLADEAR